MKKYLFFLFGLCLSSGGRAEIGIATDAQWGVFSFRAHDPGVPTYNYVGVGPAGSFGFNNSMLSTGAYISYLPGRRGGVNLGTEDASYTDYGVFFKYKFNREFFVGVKVGQAVFHLVNPKPDVNDEIYGMWQGLGGAFEIGSLHKISRKRYAKISVEIEEKLAEKIRKKTGESDSGINRLDCFKLIVSHVFII